MTKRKIQYWVIPPEANGEFAACMENVLETYAMPYDRAFPVVCMDEQPIQLLKETRVPIAGTKKHARPAIPQATCATQPVPLVNSSLPVVRSYRETLARLFDEPPTPLSLAGYMPHDTRTKYSMMSMAP